VSTPLDSLDSLGVLAAHESEARRNAGAVDGLSCSGEGGNAKGQSNILVFKPTEGLSKGGTAGMWIKPAFEEISVCAEVTAYVYTA
jgi:coenzyme PQQ precursor peptide PqqA